MTQVANDSLSFPSPDGQFAADPLTEVIRQGARRLLMQAVEAEVAVWVDQRAHLVYEQGHRQVVRNGYAEPRTIITGVGPVEVIVPRVHDRRPQGERERFTSTILPPYLRKAKSVEELIPWLYLKGISTGDFNEALVALLGPNCPGLSASTITRLKAVWEDESGMRLTLKNFTGPTTKLDMTTSFSSEAMLLATVIRSADGAHSFDFGTFDGPVQVPAGTYELITGTIGLGKQRVQISAGRMKAIELAANADQTFDWGGPARSEFGFLRRGAEVMFSPKAVWYYGVAGEEYLNWTPVGKSPEFTVKDSDTGAVLEVAILPGSC